MLRWMLLLVLGLAACGGKGANAGGETKVDLDADPLALLPGSAIAVVNVDARAVFESGSAGGEMATLAARLLPIGDEAGFKPSRDVDRVVVASYATGGADVAAVLSGRFDEAKIAAVTRAVDGSPVVRGVYAERTTFTAGAVEYAILSPKTVACGSGDGLRRLLERVSATKAAGTLGRAVTPWMLDTLQTKGAQVALAADFTSEPLAAAAVGSMNVSWLKALRVARVIGNFEPPGMNVAATLSYDDPQQAQAAVEGVHAVDGWLKVIGPALGGIRVQNLQVTAEAKDLRCKFAVDDQALHSALLLAARFLPNPQ
jgi:hypothetical protein